MSTYTISNLVGKRRFQRIAGTLVFLTAGLTLLVYAVETDAPGSKIHTLFDALWYAVTTVASVGYGDMVPVTVLGRVLGMILEIFGVGLYSTIFILVGMTLAESQDRYHWRRTHEHLENIERKLESLHRSHQYLVKAHEEQNRRS